MPYVSPDRREFLEPALSVLSSNLPKTSEALEGAIEVLLTSVYPRLDARNLINQNESKWAKKTWYEVASLAADRLQEIDSPKAGDKNYFISELILRVWFSERVSYSAINTVVGVLQALRTDHSPILTPYEENLIEIVGVLRCLEHEFLRRVHDPYEDDQITASGDIFEQRLGPRYSRPEPGLACHRLRAADELLAAFATPEPKRGIMKRFFSSFLPLFLLTTVCSAAPMWGTSAVGELEGFRTQDELVTSGSWVDDFMITWDIEAVADGWVYSYSLLSGGQDLSHVIVEVTEDSPEPIIGHNGEYLDPETYFYAGNLILPDSIFGVKIEDGSDFISFYSDRAPVYGNFFAKSGYDQDSSSWTYAYNAGLDDSLSGIIFDFIVRPDGGAIPTPEPASAALLGLGAAWVAVCRRRK